MPKHDVKLTHTGSYYDISFDDAGQLETEDSFESAIINTILSEERAEEGQVQIPELRRGWIGNQDNPVPVGSRFWVYNQLRLTQKDINLIKSEVKRALERTFVDTGIATRVRSRIQILENRVNVTVTIERPDGPTEEKYYASGDGTGK